MNGIAIGMVGKNVAPGYMYACCCCWCCCGCVGFGCGIIVVRSLITDAGMLVWRGFGGSLLVIWKELCSPFCLAGVWVVVVVVVVVVAGSVVRHSVFSVVLISFEWLLFCGCGVTTSPRQQR